MLLRVTDFETTGLAGEGKICQVGWTDVHVPESGRPEIGFPFQMFVDPGHAIPPAMRAIHHIRDRDVLGAPSVDVGLEALKAPNGRGDPDIFVAHNAKFEREFAPNIDGPWICTRKVAMRIWPDAPNHQNQCLRYWLNVDEDPDFEGWNAMPPHRAGPDTYVTAFVLRRALEKATPEQMVEWSNQPSLLPGAIHFGKHKGTPWSQLPTDYVDWMLKQQDMDEDVRFTARYWLNRRQSDDR